LGSPDQQSSSQETAAPVAAGTAAAASASASAPGPVQVSIRHCDRLHRQGNEQQFKLEILTPLIVKSKKKKVKNKAISVTGHGGL
jgi:hypothetical protein